MTLPGSLRPITGAPSRAWIFALTWLISTLALVALLVLGASAFDSPITLYALGLLLLCTFGLLWWLRNPVPANMRIDTTSGIRNGAGSTHPFRLVLLVLASCAMLFALRAVVGPPLLFGLPILAAGTLIGMRQPIPRREIAYAAALSIIAGVAGLGAGWITEFSPLLWGGLQVLLTLTSLLAGWAILRRCGLADCGVGRSQLLQTGPGQALRAAGQGILIAIPWSLGMVLMGSAKSETWVQSWWQPLTAIQPAIAEEAWGRILLVPLLFLLFRLAARPRIALTTAVLVAAYWFAFLHTAVNMSAILNTLLTGTLFALPVSYLCLYRDLETAVGFHFWLDFFKFLWVLLFL